MMRTPLTRVLALTIALGSVCPVQAQTPPDGQPAPSNAPNGLNHPELFASLGLFSPAIGNLDPAKDFDGKLSDAAAVNKSLRLLWIGIGRGDFLYEGVGVSHENLEKAGVTHVWVETNGAHVWTVWRTYLVDFASRLF